MKRFYLALNHVPHFCRMAIAGLLPMLLIFSCSNNTSSQNQTSFASMKTETLNIENAVTSASGEKGITTQESTRLYQVVLLWIKKPALFQEYIEKVEPIAIKYGGAERVLTPSALYAEGIEQPHMINIVYYNSPEAARALEEDPEFKAIRHLRDESVTMIAIDGMATGGTLNAGNSTKRLYMVELAYLKKGDKNAYTAYQQESQAVMQEYGYHVERTIKPTASHGIDMPDLVNITYFDSPADQQRFEKDARHASLEARYPQVIEKAIWAVGTSSF